MLPYAITCFGSRKGHWLIEKVHILVHIDMYKTGNLKPTFDDKFWNDYLAEWLLCIQ